MSAVPDFMIAYVCIRTWLQPDWQSIVGVKWAAYLMIQEFLIVHASGFFSAVKVSDLPLGKKALSLVGLTAFYVLFSGGVSLALDSRAILWTMAGLCVNRMLGTLLGEAPKEDAKMFAMANWAVSVVCYLFAVFLTIFAPVPPLGITEEVIRQQGFSGQGIWEAQPYRVVAACVVYYAGVGVWQLLSAVWLSKTLRKPVKQQVS